MGGRDGGGFPAPFPFPRRATSPDASEAHRKGTVEVVQVSTSTVPFRCATWHLREAAPTMGEGNTEGETGQPLEGSPATCTPSKYPLHFPQQVTVTGVGDVGEARATGVRPGAGGVHADDYQPAGALHLPAMRARERARAIPRTEA